MKQILKLILLCGFGVFVTSSCHSQDIITLKNGEEIKSKVLEVTSDQIKYKKWDNLDGPSYSAFKSEVFMIKYINGTKDVFNNASSTANTSNSGDKFIGNWFPKSGDRGGVKERLTISKAGQDYLVNYSRIEDAGGGMYINDGSFKETGHVEGSNLVINSFQKLSLLNDNTILLESEEFVKNPEQNQQTNNSNIETDKQKIVTFFNNNVTNRTTKVYDYLGKEIQKTIRASSYYQLSNTGESKNINIKRVWNFNPPSKSINFIVKFSLYDKNYSSPSYDKAHKNVGQFNISWEAGSSSDSVSFSIDISKVQTERFALEENYYYLDNTTWGGGMELGEFVNPIENNTSSSDNNSSNINQQSNATEKKKINTIYSLNDLKLIEGLIDLSRIEYADKEYFISQFNQKGLSLFAKDKIRFEQSKDFDDILIGYEQKGKKTETQGSYMYYKGILFYRIGNYLDIVRKLQNGIGFKMFVISPPSSFEESYYEK